MRYYDYESVKQFRTQQPKLCEQARKYLGGYDWKGKKAFKESVKDETGFSGPFWTERSFHSLGSTHQGVFDFFVEIMNDNDRYGFKDNGNLVKFWVKSFRQELSLMGLDDLASLDKVVIAKSFYWAVSNTIDGIVNEVVAFDNLVDFFKDDESVEVLWASRSYDFQDVDIIIRKNGKDWHFVSIKTGYAFSKRCIVANYRNTYKKKKPTLYIDQYLNRVFINKREEILKKFGNGPGAYLRGLENAWGL